MNASNHDSFLTYVAMVGRLLLHVIVEENDSFHFNLTSGRANEQLLGICEERTAGDEPRARPDIEQHAIGQTLGSPRGPHHPAEWLGVMRQPEPLALGVDPVAGSNPVLRDNQGEKGATIRMRMAPGLTDEGRA